MPKLLVVFVSLFFFARLAVAQNLEAGLTLGLTSYNGDIDIAPKTFISTLRPAVGILGKYRLSNNLLLRGQLMTGKIAGSEKKHPEAWRQERGFAFSARIIELSAVMEWEFLQKDRLTFYGFGGLAGTYFNPKTDFNAPNPYIPDVNPDAQAKYSKIIPVIPVGLGAKYAFNNGFNLAFEVGYRKTFSDYLDGVSKIANPDRKDTYFFNNLILTKEFGGGKKGANRLFSKGAANCPILD